MVKCPGPGQNEGNFRGLLRPVLRPFFKPWAGGQRYATLGRRWRRSWRWCRCRRWGVGALINPVPRNCPWLRLCSGQAAIRGPRPGRGAEPDVAAGATAAAARISASPLFPLHAPPPFITGRAEARCGYCSVNVSVSAPVPLSLAVNSRPGSKSVPELLSTK